MEVRAGCADRFFSLSFDSSPMFGDRRRTVRLCAPARCVCVCVRERGRVVESSQIQPLLRVCWIQNPNPSASHIGPTSVYLGDIQAIY